MVSCVLFVDLSYHKGQKPSYAIGMNLFLNRREPEEAGFQMLKF